MQATAAVPSIDFIKKNLATLSERKLPENEQQLAQQTLEQTLVWLDAIERAKKAQSSLEQQLSQAPQQIQQNKQALAQLAQQTDKQISPNLTILQLEQLVGEQTQQLEFWQKELNDASALIIRTQTRPERAQLEVSNNQKRIQEINAQIKGGKEGGKALLLPEALDRLQAELGALQERNKLNQAELAGNSVLQDLASSNRELLAAKVQTQERYLIALQEMLNKRRQAASEQAVQEQSLGVEKAGEDALLLKESSLNLKLSDYLLTVTERRNQLTQKSLQVRQQLENVQQIEQALEEQISVLQGSLLLAKILYQQKQALPQLSFDQRLTEKIADTRLYQFELR
ncbi:MAG: mechanosensitive channel MscK, partial [Thiopseudomonas sp.]|nr:mechanosensitive channel MscK [Thiopseudomonas sp.]